MLDPDPGELAFIDHGVVAVDGPERVGAHKKLGSCSQISPDRRVTIGKLRAHSPVIPSFPRASITLSSKSIEWWLSSLGRGHERCRGWRCGGERRHRLSLGSRGAALSDGSAGNDREDDDGARGENDGRDTGESQR